MSNVIEVYNPANAANLTDEQKAAMASLTKEEVKALAKAYPNQPHSNNYLLLFDKRLPADRQLYQVSSWQNLNQLWDIAQLQFVPFGFRGVDVQQPTVAAPKPVEVPAKTTVDLSKEDAASAEGLKKEGEPAQEDDSETLTPEEENGSIAELEKELEQLKADGAHHMKVKAVEKKIAELKGGTQA